MFPNIDVGLAEMSVAERSLWTTHPGTTRLNVEQGMSSPLWTHSSRSGQHTATYGGPNLAVDDNLLPKDVSHHLNLHPTHDAATACSSNQSPSEPSHPLHRTRVSGHTSLSIPRVQLGNGGRVRLGGSQLNNPEVLTDNPPVYTEY